MKKLVLLTCILFGFSFNLSAKPPFKVKPAPELSSLHSPAIPKKYDDLYPPRKALNNAQPGWIQLVFNLSPEGKPINIRVIDSSPREIYTGKKTIKSIMKWRFELSPTHTEKMEYSYISEFKFE